MTIADFFIKIGVKGGKDVSKALDGIKHGLGEIASMSLEAKAAIAAVVYGLEKLTGYASQVGMDLNKFAVSTGLSTDELQKWQYALGRFDVDGKETEQTIRGVQAAMTDMLLGKGAPEGLGVLAEKVGFDPARARDTFYVMSKLQEFSKKVPPDVAAKMLEGFNISPNMLQGMKMMNLETDKIAKKDIITKKEIARLTEINKAWKDFWFSLKTMAVKLVASDGMAVLYNFFDAFKLIKDVVGYIMDLVGKFAILKYAIIGIGIALGIYFAPITTLITGIIYLLGQLQKYREGKDNIYSTIGKAADGFTGGNTGGIAGDYKAVQGEGFLGKAGNVAKGFFGALTSGSNPFEAAPNAVPPGAGSKSEATGQNITQTNTFHIDGSGSPKDTANEVQKQISRAARQIGAQAEAH